MADNYKIPCPTVYEENLPEGAEARDLWALFRTYLPDSLGLILMNIIPIFKKFKNSKCKWQLIVQDAQFRAGSKATGNVFWRILEVDKPRNCDTVLLDYSGGSTWRITFTVAYCECESVFHNTKLEDQTSSGFSRQGGFDFLKYLKSPYDNRLCFKLKANSALNNI